MKFVILSYCALVVLVVCSLVHEQVKNSFDVLPIEIVGYVFVKHLDVVSKLRFYETSNTNYQRYKPFIRKFLMKEQSDGYRLCLWRVFKAWNSADKESPQKKSLRALLETNQHVSLYKDHLFRGSCGKIDFPAAKWSKVLGFHHCDCPTMNMIYYGVPHAVIYMLIERYPKDMLRYWPSDSGPLQILKNCASSRIFLQKVFELKPLDFVHHTPASIKTIISTILERNVAHLVNVSPAPGYWDPYWGGDRFFKVLSLLKTREEIEFLLDSSPPNSAEMYCDSIQTCIDAEVPVQKVARCWIQFLWSTFSLDLEKLLRWGIDDEQFTRNLLQHYEHSKICPFWTLQLSDLAHELRYSGAFCEFTMNSLRLKGSSKLFDIYESWMR